MARDAVECAQCGARAGEKELDTLLRALKVDREKVKAAPTERERASGMLFLCGGCGAFVDASAKACDRCGTPLDFEEEVTAAAPAPAPAPAPQPSAPQSTCVTCGAPLDEGAEDCVVCGAVQPAARATPQAEPEGPLCETCGAELDADGVCPICSAIDALTGLGVPKEPEPAPKETTPEPVEGPEPVATPPPSPPAEAPVPAVEPPPEPIAESEPSAPSKHKRAKKRRDFGEPLQRPVEPAPSPPAKEPEAVIVEFPSGPEPEPATELEAEPPSPLPRREPAAPPRRDRAPAPAPVEEPEAEPLPEEETPVEEEIPAQASEPEPEATEEIAEALPPETAPGLAEADEFEAAPGPVPPRPKSLNPRLAQFAETWSYLASVGLVVGLVWAALRVPFGAELHLILFGALFGVSLAFLAACARGLALGGRWTGVAAAGLLLLAVPVLRWLLGGPFLLAVDAALLVLGGLLALAGAVRIGHRTSLLLPTAAGSLALFGLALAPALSVALHATAVTALWAMGGLLVAASAGMALEGRLVEARVEASVRQGRTRHAALDAEGSIRSYDRAIRMSRRSATGMSESAWTSKGAALLLLGQLDEALQALDTALKINPANPIAWLNRGNVLARKAQFTEALWCYNQAIAANPRYEVAWNNKGNTLARLGKYEDALKCYERALEIDRNYRGAWVNKGFVLAKLGYFEEAAVCADRVLAIAGRGGAAAT
jgi:Flp pilus assembly protein TadD